MSHEYVQEFAKILDTQVKWPENDAITEQAETAFEQGMTIMTLYRGHPEVLVEALQAFIGTDSRPLAYAGAAYVLVTAGYESNQNYDAEGIAMAFKWLKQGQAITATRPEINLIEAIIFLRAKQPDSARAILNHIAQTSVQTFFTCMAEFYYWDLKRQLQRCHEWSRRAMVLATHDIQRLSVWNTTAGAYMRAEQYEEAIQMYEQVVKFDAQDPWAWHNMSWMHLQLKRYKQADNCNKRALKIMSFGAAEDIRDFLEKKRGLFGRFRA